MSLRNNFTCFPDAGQGGSRSRRNIGPIGNPQRPQRGSRRDGEVHGAQGGEVAELPLREREPLPESLLRADGSFMNLGALMSGRGSRRCFLPPLTAHSFLPWPKILVEIGRAILYRREKASGCEP